MAEESVAWEWRPGHYWPVDADKAKRVVDEIMARDGKCTPAALLDVCRNQEHVLHNCFPWEDAIAGEKWRLNEARKMLGSFQAVRIVVQRTATEPIRAVVRIEGPALVSVSSDDVSTAHGQDPGDCAFVATEVVQQNADLYRNCVTREWRQIRGWLNRTRWIPELEPLRLAAREVERNIRRLKIGEGTEDLQLANE